MATMNTAKAGYSPLTIVAPSWRGLKQAEIHPLGMPSALRRCDHATPEEACTSQA